MKFMFCGDALEGYFDFVDIGPLEDVLCNAVLYCRLSQLEHCTLNRNTPYLV